MIFLLFLPILVDRSSYSVVANLSLIGSVRLFNVGLHFLAAKVAFSWPSVDRFGKFWGGFMTLGQVKSLQNFC